MLSAALLAAGLLIAAAASPPVWLDAKTLPNWNLTHTALPARPGAPDPELAAGGRCANFKRPATSPEDAQLSAHGWVLVGPYQQYGSTVIVSGMGGADGMCRPMEYQSFVFVNHVFAGTLSPGLMNAREDASIGSLSYPLYDPLNFQADFARYSADDALCCPHATSTVTYQIKTINGRPRVVPEAVTTQKNPQ